MEPDFVDDLKHPEYTGENRCEPCTMLNLAIAAVVGSIIARKSKLGGLVAVGLSVALIYLRGYLVPGTPTLTKRYLPPAVLRWFGKEPAPEIASGFGSADTASTDDSDGTASMATRSTVDDDEETTSDEDTAAEAGETDPGEDTADPTGDQPVLDLESYFLEYDVLEPCAQKDDLCLTDEFEAAWLEEIDAIDDSGLGPADAIDAFGFDADPEEFELESRDDVQLLLGERGVAGRWPSRPALIADVAASRVLEDWTPDWSGHESETKGQVCNGLRMFLETCPTGGAVSMDEEVVESCCSSHDVVAVTCDETGERLFEQRLDTADV